MRLIDADELKERILKERDAIPKTVVERYSSGAEIPNSHGNSMRGGIRKALRCMEQTPTIDPESLRPKGRWEKHWCENDLIGHMYEVCPNCRSCEILDTDKFWDSNFCPNCGADMREG